MMTLYEEMLKRQNEAFHTPLATLVKRLEYKLDKIQRCPDAYDVKVLDFYDVVFYLKEYEKLQTSDTPLSWEELQQLKMKPVWLVYYALEDSGWALIKSINNDRVEFILPMGNYLNLGKISLGKSWNAFSKEMK